MKRIESLYGNLCGLTLGIKRGGDPLQSSGFHHFLGLMVGGIVTSWSNNKEPIEMRNNMGIIIGLLMAVLGFLIIYMSIPYSPTNKAFQKDLAAVQEAQGIQDQAGTADHWRERFTKEDFADFPLAIQKYIENCGYLGKPKFSQLKMAFKDVDFAQAREAKALKMDYTQYNFAQEPVRMALIKSSLFGIPFEGYDRYLSGQGSMKGVIAKHMTLFNQTGPEMDQACLATYLAEAFFLPSTLLSGLIDFQEITPYEVQATIHYQGQRASGIFYFNENYEMTTYTTKSRSLSEKDGSYTPMTWTARCGDYQVNARGIKHPSTLQAIWNYPDEAFIYFDGQQGEFTYE